MVSKREIEQENGRYTKTRPPQKKYRIPFGAICYRHMGHNPFRDAARLRGQPGVLAGQQSRGETAVPDGLLSERLQRSAAVGDEEPIDTKPL